MKEITGILMLIMMMFVSTSTAYTQTRQERVGKVFEIKHKTPSELEKVLLPLLAEGSKLTASDSMKTITVRDFPENVGVIEDAIKRLDVLPPITATKESFELQLNVIYGTMNTIYSPDKEIPKHLIPVIEQLQSTLKFKYYRHAFTALNRLVDNSNIEGSGVFNSTTPESPAYYNYRIQNISIEKKPNSIVSISIHSIKFGIQTPIKVASGSISYKDLGIVTPLNLNVGETVVVGTANISGVDDAIIIVVTVKKLKE